jgi:hypothetical protein
VSEVQKSWPPWFFLGIPRLWTDCANHLG